MKEKRRSVLRMASAIREACTTEPASIQSLTLPQPTWEAMQAILKSLRIAHQRNWKLAEARLLDNLHELLCQAKNELNSVENKLLDALYPPAPVSLAGVCAEFIALQDEFDEVSFSRRAGTLSVTTEPIELEQVYLGPFQIQLDCASVFDPSGPRYRAIALDPHPAASNDSVTHPHVQSERVCEGDGYQSIRTALKQGRLSDFFVLVANLLRTYNVSSPYVSLEDWHGVDCADCGNTIHDDERWSCEKCATTLCDSCVYTCRGCEAALCNECTETCSGCKDYLCNSCLKVCSSCDSEFCSECLHENETCTDCQERQTNEEADSAETETAACADTSLQPDGVGETSVPA